MAPLAERLGVSLETWEADGLGPATGFWLTLPSGRLLLFEELRHAINQLGAKGPTISIDGRAAATRPLPELLEEVLALGVFDRSDLDWTPDDPVAWAKAAGEVMEGQPAENPIHALLDAIGLPWRSSRAALEDRFGVTIHPAYQWEVIEMATSRPIVDGLLWPLSTQISPLFSPHLPATEFSGVIWFGDDARENLRRTHAQLTAALGPAKITQRYNTVRCDWRAGAASVSLVVWPPELQSLRGSNPAQDRDPRLVAGCHIGIETGWRPALSERERVWLAGFVPIADVQAQYSPEPAHPKDAAATQSELEFVRAPDVDLTPMLGRVGHSADGEALVFCHRQLYIVRMSDIAGFRVERMLPAKGSGGAWLEVACRTDYGDGETKTLTVTAAPGADDLNDLAARVAAAADKPLVLSDYHYDA